MSKESSCACRVRMCIKRRHFLRPSDACVQCKGVTESAPQLHAEDLCTVRLMNTTNLKEPRWSRPGPDIKNPQTKSSVRGWRTELSIFISVAEGHAFEQAKSKGHAVRKYCGGLWVLRRRLRVCSDTAMPPLAEQSASSRSATTLGLSQDHSEFMAWPAFPRRRHSGWVVWPECGNRHPTLHISLHTGQLQPRIIVHLTFTEKS